jgi:hypothetical protein
MSMKGRDVQISRSIKEKQKLRYFRVPEVPEKTI